MISTVLSGRAAARVSAPKSVPNVVAESPKPPPLPEPTVTAAVTTTEAEVASKTTGKMHGHHSHPKFMGGDPKQKLTNIPEEQHIQLHRDLNDFLVNQTDEFGNHMRPQRGNSGAKIRENFTLDQRRDAMADFHRQNESKYPDAAKDFFDQHPERN